MQGIAAQRHRVNRAINFSQRHIAESLSLDLLADVACLSKYHFTRVFNSHLGQTPFEFLWRTRLELAARNLVYVRQKPITDVAMDCGFSSPQAFSRAFRERFHLSPRAFRAHNRWHISSFSMDPEFTAGINPLNGNAPFEDATPISVRIEARPDYRVAYVRRIGPYSGGSVGIAAAFAVVSNWARSLGLWQDDSVMIGVCPSNAFLTPPESCLYDACIPVPVGVQEDDTVSIQNIPGGTYAVLRVACGPARIYGLWEWLTACWLPTSGETYKMVDCYELLPPVEGMPGRPETGIELCLRLKGAASATPRPQLGSRTSHPAGASLGWRAVVN